MTDIATFNQAQARLRASTGPSKRAAAFECRRARQPLLPRYGVAAAAVAVSLLGRIWLMNLLGVSLPYITFFPAILLSAWYGGLGPGLVSTVLATLAAFFFLLSPFNSMSAGDALGLALFASFGAVTAWIVQSLHNANRLAEANAALATERLQRLERHLHSSAATLANIGDGVISADPAGHITFMNAMAESLTGWSLPEVLGKRLSDLLPLLDQIQKPIERSIAPICDQNGEAIGTVLVLRDMGGVAEEIAERKRAERELRESEERFRTMADSAPVLIWMSGVDRGFTFVNKPWLEFTGMPLEEEAGEGWTRRVHPDDLEQSLKTYTEAFEARREFHMEYRLLRQDGQYRWLIAHGVPRCTESGDFAGYIGSCIDITDRKESEDALRRSNEDLKEFAYAASHDLQQPLRTMSVYSQVLQGNYQHQLDDRADQFLLGIRNGAKAMSELVRDLLAFVEAGDDDSALEPVDCGEALQTAVSNFREIITQTGAVVTSAELPAVCAQRPRVVQLFENLLGNALKYRSAAPPRIYAGAVRQGANWVFSLRDNGIGIDPKYHQRVFGLFKRLHGEEYPGTGIGLAICTRIVERYGCRIWLESERGKGSTFYFTLPAVKKESQGQ